MAETNKSILFDVSTFNTRQIVLFKRCAGTMLSDSPYVLGEFFRVKPYNVAQYNENKYFTVLCLACIYGNSKEKPKISFEQLLKNARIAQKDNKEAIDRRIDVLMSTAWNDEDGLLTLKLTQIMKLISKTVNGQPDYDKLYNDLLHWDSPERYVQRNWARTIFTETAHAEIEEN